MDKVSIRYDFLIDGFINFSSNPVESKEKLLQTLNGLVDLPVKEDYAIVGLWLTGDRFTKYFRIYELEQITEYLIMRTKKISPNIIYYGARDDWKKDEYYFPFELTYGKLAFTFDFGHQNIQEMQDFIKLVKKEVEAILGDRIYKEELEAFFDYPLKKIHQVLGCFFKNISKSDQHEFSVWPWKTKPSEIYGWPWERDQLSIPDISRKEKNALQKFIICRALLLDIKTEKHCSNVLLRSIRGHEKPRSYRRRYSGIVTSNNFSWFLDRVSSVLEIL